LFLLSPVQGGCRLFPAAWARTAKKARLCFYLMQMLSANLIQGKYFEEI